MLKLIWKSIQNQCALSDLTENHPEKKKYLKSEHIYKIAFQHNTSHLLQEV